MRIHRLVVEAFGPFPGAVDLDVDALAAEGLFLIHGPTGSGKTSLLDAICFALYADVPGARTKKGLRSDHALTGSVPRVTLEFSAGGRRFRIARSPEFSRPKKRGTGLIGVQATVTLEERVGSAWVPRGTRNDEVADVVKDVIGMGMVQFATVVLLPQGDFATFLRASPDERRGVLERLFDISDYRDVEDWLAESRRVAGADLDRLRASLAGDLARVEDVLADAGLAASPPSPPASADGEDDGDRRGEDDGDQGRGPARLAERLTDMPPDTVADRLVGLLTGLDAQVSTTMTRYDDATGAEQQATESLARGRVLADLRSRGGRAHRELEELDALRGAHEARVHTIGAAERAASLEGHLTALDRGAADLQRALERVSHTRGSLAPLSVDAPGDSDVATAAATLHAYDDTVHALRAEAEAATARSARARELGARAESLDSEHCEVTARLEAAEQVGRDLCGEVDALAALAAGVPELVLRLDAAREAVGRLDAADAALARVAELAPVRDGLRTTALDRRQELLDLRQRRLDEMAGELARSLAGGEPCPVCGSADHPAPASTADPVRPEDLEAAESRLTEADRAHQLAHDEAEAHRHRAETLRATLGGDGRTAAEAAVVQLTSRLESAVESAARHEAAVARAASHAEQLTALRRRLAAVTVQRESTRDALSVLEVEDAAGTERLADLTSSHAACPCASTESDEHAAAGRLLSDLQSAVDELTAARRRADAVESDLSTALAEAGFEDVDQARAAALPRKQLDDERALLTAYLERVAAARATAEDPAVQSALAAEAPDLPALLEAARSAREALLSARTAQDDAERTHRSLERLVPVVEAAAAAVVTATARDARVREMADTTSGSGPENTLRMRLTSFVLAARLEKVAGLANERLAVMGGGRYVLEHSDHLAARGARSGLGLRVLDQWTGHTRDTATLSGGESFMASLALALGLADAVREEAGGLDLGTLFIDEGFGTLDDDSLEQVITVLDALREGGRAVGVVSHVADLRARVTHQAVVHKGAAGSTVEIRTGAATEPAA